MSGEPLWLETDYFEQFRCKGGACRNSCCEGWQIAVGMKEYFDLIGRECSPQLHHRLECAFRTPDEPSPERFRLISPNWLGKCPLHGEDGLCELHRECGAEALPEICRVYPRSMKREDGLNQACCTGSCEAVIELLMKEEQLSFRFTHRNARPELNENDDTVILEAGPACMRILQRREKPLAARLADICAHVSGREFAVDSGEQGAALQSVVSLIGELGEESRSLRFFGEPALERYGDGDLAAFRQDEDLFEQRFPLWQRWFENILANHLFYVNFPCVDARICAPLAACGLCAVYGLMRVISVSWSRASGEESAVADAIAGVFRLVEHSPFYYNAHLLIQRPEILLTL